MFSQISAIIRNTFFESIRQPIMLVVLVVATLAILLANPLAAFTMEDDQRMLIDVGLATVFLCGALLAALIATSVLTREIENRTALTVLAKPVPRPLFVIGKFLGVGGALALATLYMSLVFLLVEMQPVRQTVRVPYHLPVIFFGLGAGVLGVGIGVWCNYFYNKVFGSTVIVLTTPLLALAYVLSMMFGPDFTPQPIGVAFKWHFWQAILAMTMAVLVLTAVAIAASTRLNQVMTLATTLGFFLLGMLSDWLFGRRIEAIRTTWLERARDEGLTVTEERTRTIRLITGETSPPLTETVDVAGVNLATMAQGWETLLFGFYWVIYALVPNLQRMMLLDALTQGHAIPNVYLGHALLYGLLFIIAAVSLATILFQDRQVG